MNIEERKIDYISRPVMNKVSIVIYSYIELTKREHDKGNIILDDNLIKSHVASFHWFLH